MVMEVRRRTFFTENLDNLSKASSVLAKVPVKLTPQFMPSSFADVSTNKFLEEVVGLPETMKDCLQQIGLDTPQRIANAFGLDIPTIANFFLQFGCDCTENVDTKKCCVHLIMLACSQALRPRSLPEDESIDWEKVKKNKKYKHHYSAISTFTKKILKDTDKVQIGKIIMRMVRKEMRANSRANTSKGGNNSC